MKREAFFILRLKLGELNTQSDTFFLIHTGRNILSINEMFDFVAVFLKVNGPHAQLFIPFDAKVFIARADIRMKLMNDFANLFF